MYELAKGTILQGKNKYVVESVLGQGGFGFTYLVSAIIMTQNIPVKTHFAVKEFFLKSHCMRNENDGCTMVYAEVAHAEVFRCQQDFKAEANRLVNICVANRKLGNEAAITNHHIVPVNECFDANGTSYFVMEFLNGGSLRSRVKESGVMSEVQALSFIRPIVDAVEFLHQHKVLHMDIKPENIVMRSGGDSQPDVPMLIDFGISLHFDDKGARTTLSNSSGLTPGYSPMEQAQPITSFDSRIDVYALAATTFYLLTGQDPVNSADVTEAYIRNALPATVSERTSNAIVHAMQPLRQFRTPSAADFLRELAASYTLPVGHILEGPFDNYRITRIVDDCGSYIRYEARRASDNHNTSDLHATQSVGGAVALAARQSIIILEQFVNLTSTRAEDNSVILGDIDNDRKSQFLEMVENMTGIPRNESLPAVARGKGGMIEAMSFKANGTYYCVCNSSFKPQSAFVKSIANVTDNASQIAGEVTRNMKRNLKTLLAIIAAGLIIAMLAIYAPKLFKGINNSENINSASDSIVSTSDSNSVSNPEVEEVTKNNIQVATQEDSRIVTNKQNVTTVDKDKSKAVAKPNSPDKQEVAKPEIKNSNKSTVTNNTRTTTDEAKSKSTSGEISQNQADKQAVALLNKLNATGTMPSAADMRRLNTLKTSASPAVQRRIEAFNVKWDW